MEFREVKYSSGLAASELTKISLIYRKVHQAQKKGRRRRRKKIKNLTDSCNVTTSGYGVRNDSVHY